MAMRVSGGRAALLVSRAQLARFSYFSSASSSSELEQPHSSALVDLKPGEIGKVSGIPEEHLHRKVVIYSPARTASQQGRAKLGKWKINFESTQKWENPLMGWTSTGDPYASVGESALSFNSKESAIEFAHKHGWKYTVRDPHEAIIQPKAYADKFKWKGPPEENES